MDDEVELVEIFRPTCLAACEHLHGSKVLKVLMVSHRVNGGSRALKVMVPRVECLKDGKELLIVCVII